VSSTTRGRDPLKFAVPAAVFAFAAVVWLVALFRYYDGITHTEPSDPCDYAQQGRNVARGLGHATSVLRPIQMTYFKYLPHPEIGRHPLFPYTLGLAFRVFGFSDGVAILPSAAFYFLSVGVVYWLGTRFLGARLGGVLSVVFLILNVEMLKTSVACLLEMQSMFAMSLVTAVLLVGRRPLVKWAAAGVLMGLGFLVRGNYLFMMPPMTVGAMLTLPRRRLAGASLFVGLFMLTISPFLIRNALLTGHPVAPFYRFSKYFFSKEYPLVDVWRVTEVPDDLDVGPKGMEWFRKGARLAKDTTNHLARLLMPSAALLLAVVGLCRPEPTRERWLMKWLFIAAMGCQLVFCSWQLGVAELRYFFCYLPALSVFAAGGLMFILGLVIPAAWVKIRWAVATAVVAVVVGQVFCGLREGKFAFFDRHPNPWRQMGEFVAENTGPDDVVLSDMGWMICWYAYRRVVWLPVDAATVLAIDREIPIKYLFLSYDGYATQSSQGWVRAMLAEPSEGALLKHYRLLKRYTARFPYGEMPCALFVKREDPSSGQGEKERQSAE